MKFTPICIAVLTLLTACNEPPKVASSAPTVEGERVSFPADSPQRKALVSTAADIATEDLLRLSGRLSWDETRTVRVFAPLGGRIVKLLAEPGQKVKAGDGLATLTSPDFGEAQAEAAKAGADFSVAEKSIGRARQLHEAGVIADKDLQQAEADFARAAAERNRTAARTRAYGGSGGSVDQQFTLRTPLEGIVVERNANPGQEVRADAGDTPALFVVSDPSRLWINLDVPEAAIASLKAGMSLNLRVASLGDETLEAKIVHVADFIDPVTRTTRARAVVENKDRRLKAEMFVNADISVPRGEFVRVPAHAVILLGKAQYVFIDEGDNRFRRQAVKAEEAGFDLVRIREGVKAGDKIVTDGALLLQQIIATSTRSKPAK